MRWLRTLMLIVIVAVIGVLAYIGSGQAAAGERVFGILDPVFLPAGTLGWPWVTKLWQHHLLMIGKVVSAVSAFVVTLALLLGRWRGAPVLLLGMAICAATWGQIVWFTSSELTGTALFLTALAFAVLLGWWQPLRSFDRLQPESRLRANEVLFLSTLVLVAFVFRTYALTELMSEFDLESIDYSTSVRTLRGFQNYIQGWMLTNNNGLFHLLTQGALYRWLGTSFYSLRLAPALFGTLAVPLVYFFVRRVVGAPAAAIAALFLAFAPEQIFWARTENSFFAPVTVATLITALLSLRMVQTWTWGACLAVALWMPFTRFFYTPSIILFAYPVLLWGHSLIFVGGARLRVLKTTPVLLLGLALWICGPTFVVHSALGGPWRFIHPAKVYGAAPWEKQGDAAFRQAGTLDLIRMQAELISRQSLTVARAFFIDGPGYPSHYYGRSDPGVDRRTVILAARAVMAALGLAYCVGQIGDPRAFAILLIVGLGLLPAVMSGEPAVRRYMILFPGLDAAAAVIAVVAVRIVHKASGRFAAAVTGIPVVATVAIVCVLGWIGYFAPTLRMQPVRFGSQVRFFGPAFAASDTILHGLERRGASKAVLFGNLDAFLERPLCYRSVDDQEWRTIGLNPSCEMRDEIYSLLLTPEEIALRQSQYQSQRTTFVLQLGPTSARHLETLRALYPTTAVYEFESKIEEQGLVSVTVDQPAIAAHHRVEVIAPSADLGEVLSGVPMRVEALESAREITLRGGFVATIDGWYSFDISPACEAGTLKIGEGSASGQPRPVLAGVHDLELTIPVSSCSLPLHLRLKGPSDTEFRELPASSIVAPRVAQVPLLRAAPIASGPGFGPVRTRARIRGQLVDVSTDSSGHTFVLGTVGIRGYLARVDDGQVVWDREVTVPASETVLAIVVDPNSEIFVATEHHVIVFGADGNERRRWKLDWAPWFYDIALIGDRLVLPMMDRSSLVVFEKDGRWVDEITTFNGGSQPVKHPVSLTAGPGDVALLLQDDATAVVVQGLVAGQPRVVNSFRVDFGQIPYYPRGCEFLDETRVVIPNTAGFPPLLYDLEGRRLFADDQERDLGRKAMGVPGAFHRVGNTLLTAEVESNGVFEVDVVKE